MWDEFTGAVLPYQRFLTTIHDCVAGEKFDSGLMATGHQPGKPSLVLDLPEFDALILNRGTRSS